MRIDCVAEVRDKMATEFVIMFMKTVNQVKHLSTLRITIAHQTYKYIIMSREPVRISTK